MTGSYFPYVIQSYGLGVERAVRRLVDTTGGRVAFVRSEAWLQRSLLEEMMEERFREVVGSTNGSTEPITITGASTVSATLLQANAVRGVFCCDDSCAVRAIGRLRQEGVRIPGDISLVSYGNTELARYFTPSITSVDPHSEEMAALMARILEMHIGGESTKLCQYVVQPELVIRET
jgi:DNA-binding LacI/PurR family transcriptional regulator